MSNIISKIRQRIATREMNKFNLTCDHFTTSDFMKLAPVYIKEMVPGEKIVINQSTFTRLAPMVKPTYGRCRIENRAFFVPIQNCLMRAFNEFITDSTYDGQPVSVPTISLHNLASMLAVNEFSTTASTAVTTYDFKTGSGTTGTRYKFTVLGKTAWQVLNSLGYKFPIGYWLSNTDTTAAGANVSALPLMAFIKIYYDWYKAQAYSDATFYGIFDSLNYSALDNVQKLISVFKIITKVCYDKDEVFVSAWDRPVGPNNNLVSPNEFFDITNESTVTGATVLKQSVVVNKSNNSSAAGVTPAIQGQTASDQRQATPANITQYCIDALKALTDYVKRHQLAGGQAMDRLMSRFGFKPDNATLRRSIYLGKNTVEVNIADVMATANGQDGSDQSSALGDYAGKGVGYDKGSFEYKTDQYGYIVITSTIIPSAHYVQGMNPIVQRTDRLSFYTPEFDRLGVAAIARKNLLSTYNGYNAEDKLLSLTPNAALEGVFGFSSRYWDYKCQFDNLTGDFVVPSLNEGNNNTDVWHLNRMFNPSGVTIDDVTHNLNFVSATDAGQYDRIFAIVGHNDDGSTANKYDHFYTIHHFDIISYAPMAKLFDDYDFDGGKKEVSIEVNGTQLN